MQEDKDTGLFLTIKEFFGLTEVNITAVDTLIVIIGIIIAILSLIEYFRKQRVKKK